jgi:hypothetical protein
MARLCVALLLALVLPVAAFGQATQSKNLAPGFTSLPKGSKVALMPTDIELFSISAGGVLEPKADWTDAASRHFRDALLKKKRALNLDSIELAEKDADEFAEINSLHAAVARSIAMHHFGAGSFSLPTKEGKLDWSIGDTAQAVRKATGADYALFSWVRDSYASPERKAALVAMAIFGFYGAGGMQVGYASLVDLSSGRVLWFNQLLRTQGDLREAKEAEETLDSLLASFPVTQ